MKTRSLPVFLVYLVQFLHCSISSAQQCKPLMKSEFGYTLLSSAYLVFTNEDLGSCYLKCTQDPQCSSINYDLTNGKCEHSFGTKKGFPSRFVRKEQSVYMEVRTPDYGSTKRLAVSSCKKVLELIGPKAESGIYWIRLGNGSTQTPPFQVFCDMTTDGGGWTLVWSYRFNYPITKFSFGKNAVKPIPTWPVNLHIGLWAPRSTTVPLKESSRSAMNFTLWKEIGTEFLIKPNITHWVSCKPGTGDLVNWKAGSLNCKNVKNVATHCLGYAPTGVNFNPKSGPFLYINSTSSVSFYFDGRMDSQWVRHDPCAKNSAKYLFMNKKSPGGAFYIR